LDLLRYTQICKEAFLLAGKNCGFSIESKGERIE